MNGSILPISLQVNVDGYPIHYLDIGSGPPVLFIHGNPTSSYTWRSVLAPVALGTQRRCLALDLLGFGQSAKPNRKYTLDLHAAIVAGFIERLGLKDLILVGEDWGGPLAVAYAVRRPDAVRGVAVMETFMWPLDWKNDFMPCVRTLFRLIRGPAGFMFIQVMNQLTRRMIPRYCTIAPQALQHYIDACPTIRSRRAMRDFPKLLPIGGYPRASVHFFEELAAGLARTAWPLLWIKATPGLVPADNYPPSLVALEEFCRRVPRTEVTSFGPGRHFLAEQGPLRLSQLLTDWIQRIGASSRPLGLAGEPEELLPAPAAGPSIAAGAAASRGRS